MEHCRHSPLGAQRHPTIAALFACLVSAPVALPLFEVEDRRYIGRIADTPLSRVRPGCKGLVANRPALVPHLNGKFRMLAEPVFNRLLRSGPQISSTRRLDFLHNL